MNDKVSIIVPCYNQAQFLSQCLDSILAQTYTNWECIIINDGSLDNSQQVIEAYVSRDTRIRYVYQENQGPSVARNNGILQSKGEFILPLDADDKIAETYLEKALSIFETQPDVKLVYCKAELYGDVNELWQLPPYSYEELLWGNMIFCSALYRRSDYDKTNGYNPNMKEGLEDWDFWLSFLLPSDKVYQIDEVLFYYRKKADSRTKYVEKNEKLLLRDIYNNHRELYAPYISDIIFFHNIHSINECMVSDAIQEGEDNIRSTNAYRLGKILLKPLSWLRNIVNKE